MPDGKFLWMAVSIKHYMLVGVGVVAFSMTLYSHASTLAAEPVQACVITADTQLTTPVRNTIAQCLGWQQREAPRCRSFLISLCPDKYPSCGGKYTALAVTPPDDPDTIEVQADKVSFRADGRSALSGHVKVRQAERIISADTAYVHRDAKTNQITKVELLGHVRYIESDKLMYASRVELEPHHVSGHVEDVLYRFDTVKEMPGTTILPAWGRAKSVYRFENKDMLLRQTTYSTCPPPDRAWQIEAAKITLDHDKEKGVARDAIIRVKDLPVLYAPYLTFPTSKARKSGFLMPTYGYSNIGGFDFSTPYYWNMAPNYDSVIIPHLYTMRGVMIGGDFRFLTQHSSGNFSAHVLPHDRAQAQFIAENRDAFPSLSNVSKDRWAVLFHDKTKFAKNAELGINFQSVSDDYYLQDFSTNLAVITENQLLQEGYLSYNTEHWLFKGMLQAYQTLHPITQSDIFNIYERLPEVLAQGKYTDLVLNGQFSLLGQFDYFNWPSSVAAPPQGPRSHVNPVLSFPQVRPWGYITPEIQLVQNNYRLHYSDATPSTSFNRTIPRYSIDSNLVVERDYQFGRQHYVQTLEPRLFYLYVPYRNQSEIPAFDSAYMIFTTEQLFRTNRFSGYDRITDANQLAYALTSRWLSPRNGEEIANITVGQIRYFSDREVQLCYQQDGNCQDNSAMLGFLSPVAKTSPIASRLSLNINKRWTASASYVWDTYTKATNNADVNVIYHPEDNKLLRVSYGYFVDANIIDLPSIGSQNGALNQITGAYGWPFSERWSSLGIYSYNLSKGYGMIAYFGLQYDSCCWAFRLLGGQTFQSINASTSRPNYNNNGYIQILLKGLGSAGNSDPATVLRSYLPGYPNIFSKSVTIGAP